MIKAIVFDMDGVIVDSEPLWQQMLPLYLRTKGIHFVYDTKSLRLINLHFRGRKQKYITSIMRQQFHLTGSYQTMLDERLKILFALFDKKLKLITGTLPFIKKLHAKKYRLVLASSSPHPVISYIVKRYHLKKYFRHVISADDVRHGKPAPDIFLRAARLLKEKPSHLLVIEDSISGIQAAHNAQMKCVALRRSYTPKKYLSTANLATRNLSSVSLKKLQTL